MKRKVILSAVKSAFIFLAFFVYTPILVFGTYLNFYREISCDSQNGTDTYRLYDTVIDPDEFGEALRDQRVIQHVFLFYEELEKAERVQYSTVYNQPIVVHDLKCTEESVRLENMGITEGDTLVKALQVNQNATQRNLVEFSEGEIDWETVRWSNENTPVFLGAQYKPWYAVGDEISASFYNEEFKFVVAGFFDDQSQIIFRDEKYDLKDYMVVPYPVNLQKLECTDNLKGMLAFSMIRGDLSIQHSEDSMQKVWEELESIKKKSGFSRIGIEGVTKYILTYEKADRLFHGNASVYALVLALLLFAAVCTCVFLEAQTLSCALENVRRRILLIDLFSDAILYLLAMIISCVLLGYQYEIDWRALIEVTTGVGMLVVALLTVGKLGCIRVFIKRKDRGKNRGRLC